MLARVARCLFHASEASEYNKLSSNLLAEVSNISPELAPELNICELTRSKGCELFVISERSEEYNKLFIPKASFSRLVV